MKYLIFCLSSLFLFNCNPKSNCAEIGDDYIKIAQSCGKPFKHDYRNGRLIFAYYADSLSGNIVLTIGFNEFERADQIHYDDGTTKIDNYAE